MNLFLGLMLAGLVYEFTLPIFALQNAGGTLLDLTARYFQIRVWGFPLTLLTFTLFGAFRGWNCLRQSYCTVYYANQLTLYFIPKDAFFFIYRHTNSPRF